MTTFPKPLATAVPAAIKATAAKVRVHAQKISQLESANAKNQATIATQAATITSQGATITSQGSAISTLNTTVSNLLNGNVTIGGNLTVDGGTIVLNGTSLTTGQLSFLVSLGPMTIPSAWPLADDGNSGSTWVTGERGFVNSSIDLANLIVQKLINEGYMT